MASCPGHPRRLATVTPVKSLASQRPPRYPLRMADKPPPDPADHAEDFSRRWADQLDRYWVTRMQELGIPDDKNGAPDFSGDGRWLAFQPRDRTGGNITSGVVVNSGCLNPQLLKGRNGGRLWQKARLRDRIDAIIAHEWEEDRLGSHEAALKSARKTGLPVSEGARRILRAMGR